MRLFKYMYIGPTIHEHLSEYYPYGGLHIALYKYFIRQILQYHLLDLKKESFKILSYAKIFF